MSFKLSILLLSLILAANSVSDDEYEGMDTDLKDEYKDIEMGLTIEDLDVVDDDFIKDFVSIQLHPTEPVKTEGPSQTQATHSLNCSCEPDPIETEVILGSMQSEKLHPTEPVKTEGPSQTQATHSLNCSCEPDPIETEILNESYKHCRRWNRKNPRDGVTRVDFWYFIGKNQSDFGIIQQYYRDHPYILQGAFDLDGNGYGKLFKYICKKRGVTVKNWAENRKNRAEKESREMTGRFDWYHEE